MFILDIDTMILGKTKIKNHQQSERTFLGEKKKNIFFSENSGKNEEIFIS